MNVHAGVMVETYVTIDGAPVEIELLKADRQVQIMIGLPGGSYLILMLSNPTYITRIARQITEAGVELALLLAATDLLAQPPRELGTLLADGCGNKP